MEQQWFYIPPYNRIYKDYGNLFLLNCPFLAHTHCNKINVDLLSILIKCERADIITISIIKIERSNWCYISYCNYHISL